MSSSFSKQGPSTFVGSPDLVMLFALRHITKVAHLYKERFIHAELSSPPSPEVGSRERKWVGSQALDGLGSASP